MRAKSNDDYFAFGREALCPADGIITDVITGVRDNVPGSMNPYSALGNAVFIKHREHEISVLAHFKQGLTMFSQTGLYLGGKSLEYMKLAKSAYSPPLLISQYLRWPRCFPIMVDPYYGSESRRFSSWLA